MKSSLSILQHYWKHDQFRPMQEEIIQSVLDGKDTLALLPTGGGKSICFQVPALLMDGLCLVISPLIALMQDQVSHLTEKGIPAASLNSGMTYAEVKSILQKAARGDYKFLYVSPERIESALFKEYLSVLDISLIAVDEAHCISQWGYDFRPPYLRIAALREELEGVTIIALTASATEKVKDDIIQKLLLENVTVFRQSFERAALSYSCFETESKINKLIQILQGVPGSSIVYANSRRLTKEVCQLLQLQGITADFYHAGLTQEERERKQKAWIQDQVRVMVCTNAFGMGIDKPSVRSVIHYNVPDCLENYYQEAGRAGRDGKKAFAVLLYHPNDVLQLQELPDKKFPPVTTIQSIYQSLADFFQLPVGSGEGAYFDFDLRQFTENFKLDTTTVINTLKVLEQEGHISFAESIFLPSQVMFTTDKEALYAFENAQPSLETLIKILLRTYEGIFDNRVSIFELSLAKVMRTEPSHIQHQLKELAAYGIIEYLPKKESPQIHYLLNRAPAKYLHIDHDAYHARKKNYTDRVQDMIRYLRDADSCRSRLIGNYFGDKDLSACGICDHCLIKKKKELSHQDFSVIEKHIRNTLTDTTQPIDQLLVQLSTFSKEKVWTVLDFLQTEGELMISENGQVSLLNH
ncbi:MAG: ATP-dependent DNA helicase RecQ [Sediminibacterium sp.]|uniref:RecQ family ATP-dependent DNA helicase n=1 Tax=Sediminibacterium sp. TaxID=1917865 RepID=UPI002AB9458B|nr:ATP-dependent DNA helicase RecQ [Sediminibacterium sp.]MDZ4071655.1 ATP-dependent DNA helicase RecQ [Sediminibacterium sp.]